MTLSKRRWYNKLIFFYKIIIGIPPDYLHSCIKFFQNKYPLRSVSPDKLKYIPSRTKSFSETFFFHIVFTNGINLIQKLETQNLYVNLKNQL